MKTCDPYYWIPLIWVWLVAGVIAGMFIGAWIATRSPYWDREGWKRGKHST